MVVQFKTILPKKFNTKPFIKEAAKALTDWNDIVYSDFQSNVKTFKRKPKFERVKAKVTPNRIISSVLTDNLIYRFIVRGTRPHIIRPRRAAALRFKSGYKSKTNPKRIPGRKGGSFGSTVQAKIVRHPGNEARNTDLKIKKKRGQKQLKRLIAAYKKAAKESGHSL